MSGPGEGSVFAILEFPMSWPSKTEAVILRRPFEGGLFELKVDTHGRLAAYIFDSGTTVLAQFTSVPVVVYGKGAVMLVATWERGACKMFMNSERIPASGSAVRFEMFLPDQTLPTEHSLGHARAVTACHTWIQNRKKKISVEASASAQPVQIRPRGGAGLGARGVVPARYPSVSVVWQEASDWTPRGTASRAGPVAKR